jgi:hypothetical protein
LVRASKKVEWQFPLSGISPHASISPISHIMTTPTHLMPYKKSSLILVTDENLNPYKSELLAMGGFYNARIINQPWKQGWIFNKANHPAIVAWVVKRFNEPKPVIIELKVKAESKDEIEHKDENKTPKPIITLKVKAEVECGVCYNMLHPSSMNRLMGCDHQVCQTCLPQLVKTAINPKYDVNEPIATTCCDKIEFNYRYDTNKQPLLIKCITCPFCRHFCDLAIIGLFEKEYELPPSAHNLWNTIDFDCMETILKELNLELGNN